MVERQLKVLVAEDASGTTAKAVASAFQDPESQLELSTVCTLPTLLATLELGLPEVIFLDLSLAPADPLDGVKRVHRAAPGVPLIVCGGVADKAAAARSLSAGAIDYLLKGFMDSRIVERTIRAALEHNTLEGLADLLRDELTGLYTREGFMTLGTRAMDVAVRSGGTLVLLCMMIENFARLQQEFGSASTDETVCEMTDLLRSCFRRSDLLGRLGKAQFCALAVDAAEPSAPILCQRVESRIETLNLGRAEPRLAVRFSVGFWGANDARSFSEFLDSVEADLRHAQAPVVREEHAALKVPETQRSTSWR